MIYVETTARTHNAKGFSSLLFAHACRRLSCCRFFVFAEQMRRLALEIEVKHGRMALGAVVCAMAQQGLVTVGA